MYFSFFSCNIVAFFQYFGILSGTREKSIDAHCARMHARLRRHFKDICEHMREALRQRLG